MHRSLAESVAELVHGPVASGFQTLSAVSLARPELSDEDVVARLLDPRAFGLFARRVLDARVSREVKIAVADRAFDLIPIPASEHAVLRVDERTPPGLLRLVRFLLENEAFSVLHLLHLVYASFLDPELLRRSDRATRAWVLMAIVARGEFPEAQRLLASFQFLASMAPRDAASAFDGIVKAKFVSPTVRSGLAAAASSSDGGRAWFEAVAVQEGLVSPTTGSEVSDVERAARVPALPENVRVRARRWLERQPAVGPPPT